MPESSSTNFTVQFSKQVARSLDYEDANGRLIFVFEFGSSSPFILRRQPLSGDYKLVEITDQNRAWLTAACERAKGYLQSCGYEVEVSPSSSGDT